MSALIFFNRIYMADEPTKLDISDEMIAERRGGSGKMPEDMPSWMASSIVNID